MPIQIGCKDTNKNIPIYFLFEYFLDSANHTNIQNTLKII